MEFMKPVPTDENAVVSLLCCKCAGMSIGEIPRSEKKAVIIPGSKGSNISLIRTRTCVFTKHEAKVEVPAGLCTLRPHSPTWKGYRNQCFPLFNPLSP